MAKQFSDDKMVEFGYQCASSSVSREELTLISKSVLTNPSSTWTKTTEFWSFFHDRQGEVLFSQSDEYMCFLDFLKCAQTTYFFYICFKMLLICN